MQEEVQYMRGASFADEELFMWKQRGYGPIWLEPAKYIRIWIRTFPSVPLLIIR